MVASWSQSWSQSWSNRGLNTVVAIVVPFVVPFVVGSWFRGAIRGSGELKFAFLDNGADMILLRLQPRHVPVIYYLLGEAAEIMASSHGGDRL